MSFNIGQLQDKKGSLGITRDLLIDLYWSESRNVRQIASTLGVTGPTVLRWMKFFSVPTRRSSNFKGHVVEPSPTQATARKCVPSLSSLSSYQRSVLLGTLCGDACLKQTSPRKALLSLHHGMAQQDYLEHKVEIFGTHVSRISVYAASVEAVTPSTEEFLPWYQRFYPGGKKFLSQEILEDLDETSLAYWYLDDGSLSQLHYTIWLHASMVSDAESTARLLGEKFGIKFSIQHSNTNQMLVLYVPSSGTGAFTRMLLRNAPACMKWKIHPWYRSVLDDNQQPSLNGNVEEGSTTAAEPKAVSSLEETGYGGKSRPWMGNHQGMPGSLLLGG